MLGTPLGRLILTPGKRPAKNTGGGGAPALWTPLLLPGIGEFIDPTDASSVTLVGSNVSAIADKNGQQPVLQATDANRGTLANGRVVLGTSAWMVKNGGRNHAIVPTLLSTVTVPDVTPFVANKGFTNTGFAKAKFGRSWVGNHGKATGAAPSYTSPGLVLLNADKAFQAAVTCASLGLTDASVQGVVELPDGTVWFALADTNLLAHIQPTYNGSNQLTGATLLGTLPFTGANGLTYDAALGKLIVCPTGNNVTASWISPTDGTVLKTLALTGTGIDHLDYPSDGDLWYTSDTSITTRIDTVTGYIVEQITTTEAPAIEGVSVTADGYILAADNYYHSAGNLLNSLITYSTNVKKRVAPGNKFVMFGVLKVISNSALTKGLVTLGQPISASVPGAALLITGSAFTGLRLTANNAVANFTVPDMRNLFSYIAIFDLVAGTATLYINGTLIGTITLTGTPSAAVVPYAPLMFNAYLNNTTLTAGGSEEIGAQGVATGLPSTDDINRLAGALAWKSPAELVSVLDAGNPYKTAAPLAA